MGAASHDKGSAEDLLIWGGVVGPAFFVADWVVLGAIRANYSPVHDAISRLAELGATTRLEMSAGFLVYGLGLLSYGAALRRSVPGSGWLWALGTGVSTLGVAAYPLGTPTSGTIHAGFAVIGYATLAALPIAVSRALSSEGRQGAARASAITGVLSGAFLLASAAGAPAHGLTQRIGLTLGDVWMIASAISLIRRAKRG